MDLATARKMDISSASSGKLTSSTLATANSRTSNNNQSANLESAKRTASLKLQQIETDGLSETGIPVAAMTNPTPFKAMVSEDVDDSGGMVDLEDEF